jgi:hypothetical protein
MLKIQFLIWRDKWELVRLSSSGKTDVDACMVGYYHQVTNLEMAGERHCSASTCLADFS